MEAGGDHFKRPGWLTKNVFNRVVAWLTRAGISVWGSRVLEVRGRSSGQPRRTPVNLLTVDGQRYLVAPRGHTQWVRNLRASGQGRLQFLSRVIARSLRRRPLRAPREGVGHLFVFLGR